MLRRKVLLVKIEIYISNAIIDFTWNDNRNQIICATSK